MCSAYPQLSRDMVLAAAAGGARREKGAREAAGGPAGRDRGGTGGTDDPSPTGGAHGDRSCLSHGYPPARGSLQKAACRLSRELRD